MRKKGKGSLQDGNIYCITLNGRLAYKWVDMQTIIKFQTEMYFIDIDKRRFEENMDPDGFTEIYFRQVFSTGIYSMPLFVIGIIIIIC